MGFLLLFLWLIMVVTPSKGAIQVRKNHPRFDRTPYVLLISIDGHRHDYNRLHRPPVLSQFAKEGIQAKSLIPVFPSKTFASHFSLISGRYPGRHGIVDNKFYAPKLKKSYSLKDRKSVADATFYSGTPLWTLASINEMVSAVYFWPGSEAPVKGHIPSFFMPYKHSTPPRKRAREVVRWFKLPLRERPHFVSLYLSSDVDFIGHKYGPNSKEIKEAILKVDNELKYLLAELAKLKWDLNIIITSDHGMIALDESKRIIVDKKPKIKRLLHTFVPHQNSGPFLYLYYQGPPTQKKKTVDALMAEFSKEAKHYKAYRRRDLPKRFHARNNPRFGDIVLLADPPWSIGIGGKFFLPKGFHGYDPKHLDMHGAFFAQGPGFKKGLTVESFENVHIYPLVAKLLGLPLILN